MKAPRIIFFGKGRRGQRCLDAVFEAGHDVALVVWQGNAEDARQSAGRHDVDLAQYKGKVLLIVNVASKCGLTPQYEQLVALQDKYADQGFTVLGFPANNFMQQEPGTNAEIKTFCSTKFGVQFPMFSKISVKGDDQAPLYEELTSKDSNGEFGGEIAWNFTKFLVNKEGKVVSRFEPRVKPDAPEVTGAIEEELAS